MCGYRAAELPGAGVAVSTPTKCTPETTAAICASIRKGMPKCQAAALAGVNVKNVEDWQAKGAAGDDPYADFARQYAEARADRVQQLIAVIEEGARAYDAGPGHVKADWKAAAWLLEKGEPLLFGSRAKVEVTGADGGPVAVSASVVIVPAEQPTSAAWAARCAADVTAKVAAASPLAPDASPA